MTPRAVEQADALGHRMASGLTVNGRLRWVCRTCMAVVQVDEKNPDGFGSALERDCTWGGGDAA